MNHLLQPVDGITLPKMQSRDDDPAITEFRDLRAVQGVPSAVLPVHQLFPMHLVADARAFVEAGWVFMSASDAAHLRAGTARVFTDGERLLLFDGSMNIKFQRDISPAKIEQLLRHLGLEIIRQVPVAPNVFRVRSAHDAPEIGQDPIRFVEGIQRHAEVIYSEPDFIESIPHR